MQIIQSKGNIVEKVIRNKDGKLIRARFFVFESNGRMKARLIDFIYITAGAISGSVSNLYISLRNSVKSLFEILVFKLIDFKLFNYLLGTIYCLGSKPRAPTFT